MIINENNLLIPAIAEKYDHERKTFTYFYDASKESFINACPAKTRNEKKLQKKWREKEDILSQNSSLLFAYPGIESQVNCKQKVVPSIKKTSVICNPSGDKFYEVGYPVNNFGKLLKPLFFRPDFLHYILSEKTIGRYEKKIHHWKLKH